MSTVETPREVRAQAKYVRMSPRKARLVAEHIRGRSVPEARAVLAFTAREAAGEIDKVLQSAVSNAEANHGIPEDRLYISHAYVDGGPVMKRWRNGSVRSHIDGVTFAGNGDRSAEGRAEMDEQLIRSALDYHRLPVPGKISVLPTKGLTLPLLRSINQTANRASHGRQHLKPQQTSETGSVLLLTRSPRASV